MNKKTYPLYKFACGCVSPHPGQNINGLLNNCPVHNAKAIGKIFKCEFCGKETETSVRTVSLRACSDCKVEAHKQYNRKYYHNIQKHNRKPKLKQTTPISGRNAPKRRYDCAYYDECMQVDGALMKDPGACQNCSRYAYQELDVMDYITQCDYDGNLINS